MIRLFLTSFLCLSVVCVSPEIKKAVQTTSKYQSQYVEYANKKIQENPDEKSEEMVGVGERLDRNLQKINKFFNGN
jgi:hypothetical protein